MARVAPVIRKAWISDVLLEDGTWIQGTWMYLEVEPGRWLAEIDPGGASFVARPERETPADRQEE